MNDTPSEGRTALYRLYDAEEDLLYIGISRKLTQRFREHEHSRSWWHCVKYVDLTWFDSHPRAYAAEKAAQHSERPPYNGVGHLGLGWHVPRITYDDSADRAAIRALLLNDLRTGKYAPGKHLWELTVSREYGYSRMSTSSVMWALADEGHLVRRKAGYNVPAR
ncbi:GIY-YIG nuclease family protein [Streptomyces sp. NPDC018019]|uniref:GIY-YIG nuclease family protein n=1 Tax=Streptomyces sp. NPDC018019 TaxID=3365030 RepID=UPI00378FA99F